jgi:pimeloyl-ACP methyl ester carboxylesterase
MPGWGQPSRGRRSQLRRPPHVVAFVANRVLVVLAAFASGAVFVQPALPVDGCTPARGDVRFRAADGTRLAGHRFGSGSTAVVLVHQSDGDLCQWVPYARRLAGLGYLALVVDLRGHGASQTRHYPANQRLAGDVAAASREARALGARKVFLLGASLGGSAVVSAAANVRPAVAGVISVSGSADLVDALQSAPRVRVPALLIAAKGDLDFAPDVGRLYAVVGSARKTRVLLPGSAHGVQLVGTRKRARDLIERFLRSD